MYIQIKKNNIVKTLQVIDELNKNYPMMEINDINFSELKKATSVNRDYFLSMIVFMDYLNSKQVHVNVHDITKLQVRKNNNEWKFTIHTNMHKQPLTFQHSYRF